MRKDDEVVLAPATNQNRRLFATKTAWPGGEIARGGAENGYAALVAPISGWRKVFCDGSKADSAKVFVPGGSGSRNGDCQVWSRKFSEFYWLTVVIFNVSSCKHEHKRVAIHKRAARGTAYRR
jgi:hypothetical protein